MKSLSTILFFSFIITISCSNTILKFRPNDHEVDLALVELNKEPASEAVFATMATQLSTQGGFSRVMGLLNNLVHDSREQLHEFTKTWRKVKVNCEITKLKLKNREDYFRTHEARAHKRISEIINNNAEYDEFVKSYDSGIKVYKNLLKDVVSRNSADHANNKRKTKQGEDALKAVANAIKVVKNWTPNAAALVQTSMTRMIEDYSSVTKMKDVEFPTELLQRTTDNKVKARALQWLNLIKVRILSSMAEFTTSKKRANREETLVRHLAEMVKLLKKARKAVTTEAISNKAVIEIEKDTKSLMGKLGRENASLIKSIKEYCDNEKTNFTSTKTRVEVEIKLFKEIINYFNEHYAKISSFIKQRYHKHDD